MNTPLTSPLPSANMALQGRTRQCHGCHGPCDDSHRGYPTGADRCTLEHDDRCEGGIVEGFDRLDSKWRGCPTGYVTIEDDFSDGDLQENSASIHGGVLGASSLVNGLAEIHLLNRKVASSVAPPEVVISTSIVSTSVVSSMLMTSSNPSTATSTSVTASGLGSTMFSGDGVTVLDQVSAARQRLLALKKQREGLEALAQLQKEEQLEAAETRRLQDQLNLNQKPVRPRVGEAASRLRVRNQPGDQNNDNGFYNGLTLPEIRKVPGLATVVESRIDQVRSEVPSLSRRPDASLGGPRKQHPGVPLGGPRRQVGSRTRSVSSARQHNQDVFDPFRFQQSYVHDLIVMDDAEPHPNHQPVQSTGHQMDLLTADPETDPSDEEESSQQMRLVYRRDQNGYKYRTWEPVQDKQPQVVYEWVTDERTGRQYKQPVQSQVSSQSQRFDQRNSSHSVVTRPPKHHERAPTFVSLTNSEKEGKVEKKPTIIDWAEKVNFDSMNAIVWLWGYLSEILAAKTSNEVPMEAGVLDAKLQHALCVLEVCASHSEKTDFDTHGWRVAKLYAHKVQAQLDRGLVSWLDFAEFKANPHPSELIAATHELEQKQKVKKKAGEETRQKSDKPICSTWNSSKVEGRCDWQVRNPDKGRCNRRHDCSYCTEKGHGSTNHQKSFCARRIAAGDA